MKLWISTFAITESALSVPNPFEDESKVRFSSTIVSLLLFCFAFHADAFRTTSRPENAVCDLLLDREPEAPLNGAVRNRNHVNLRPPRVEYRNSRDATYRHTIFRTDWTIVTLPSTAMSIRRRLSNLNGPFPTRNRTPFITNADRQPGDLPTVLIKCRILDARIDYPSCVTWGKCIEIVLTLDGDNLKL